MLLNVCYLLTYEVDSKSTLMKFYAEVENEHIQGFYDVRSTSVKVLLWMFRGTYSKKELQKEKKANYAGIILMSS